MRELVQWLEKVEMRVAGIYGRMSLLIPGDRDFSEFALKLAGEEQDHARLMTALGKKLSHPNEMKSTITIDDETREVVGGYLSEIEARMDNLPLSKEALIEAIVSAELSEWNDIFLYVVDSFKENNVTMQNLASRVTKHRREIERFAEKAGIEGGDLRLLKEKPGLWKANILIIEDDASVRDILAVILRRIGRTAIADSGREALDKMKGEYFDLIFSDIDMPVMNGVDFYREATGFDPDLGKRLIYFTGQSDEETLAFLRKNNLAFITKPSSMSEIREAAESILKR